MAFTFALATRTVENGVADLEFRRFIFKIFKGIFKWINIRKAFYAII